MAKTINALFVTLYAIASTQAKKIASAGFGTKNDCFGYLNSSSMSILNEKCVAFMYHTLKQGHNRIYWEAGVNSFRFDCSVFNTCCNVVTIKGTFTLINRLRCTVNDFSTADIEIKITLPQSSKEQAVNPSKYMGEVKNIKYGDTYYHAYPYTLTITQ